MQAPSRSAPWAHGRRADREEGRGGVLTGMGQRLGNADHGGWKRAGSEPEFGGVIAENVRDSRPWWPTPNRPDPGSPDIVIVVFDDVGFSDFGCFGSTIDTPTIDGIAANGLLYNNFHTTALCSPTRACLLTGRNHHSVGMGVVSNWDTGFPGYRGRVTKHAGTLAEMLGQAGYATMAVGKWHLAPIDETSAAGPYDQWPLGRGFNRFYGFMDGATSQWLPDLVYDNHRIDPPREAGYHVSEDLIDHAIAFVRDQVSLVPEQPLFLYCCFGAAHSPLHAPAEFIDRYRGRFDHGWDAERSRRLARQIALGIVPEETVLAPRNAGVVPWEEMSVDEQRVSSAFQEVYAAMIEHADHHLGRLVGALVQMGRLENTLLLVLSDNGATLEGGPNGATNYLRWVNGLGSELLDSQLSHLSTLGGPWSYPVYPMGWGQVSNTPLKRYKQNTHAGGVRDPLVVSWPRRISDAGSIRGTFCHAVDVVPTVLDLLGCDAAPVVGGIEQMPVQGTSFAPSLLDATAQPAGRVQYFEMLGNRGLWRDGWKAVSYHRPGTSFEDDTWELYHLDEDFSEARDLARQEPDRLGELQRTWWDEARRYDVLPLDDRILERFLVDKPRPVTDRSRFVYYPGIYVPSEAAVSPIDVSHVIKVVMQPYQDGDEGVLLAHGDRHAGYVLFISDGVLSYGYNRAGTVSVVRAHAPVPIGATELRMRFRRSERLGGQVQLLHHARVVGSGSMAGMLGVHINAIGVSIGRDTYGPVIPEYEAPFAFSGALSHVEVELGDDRGHRESDWIAD